MAVLASIKTERTVSTFLKGTLSPKTERFLNLNLNNLKYTKGDGKPLKDEPPLDIKTTTLKEIMTYKELQVALKSYKQNGLTTIPLNSPKSMLEAELERLTVAKTQEIEPEIEWDQDIEVVEKTLTLPVNKQWFDMIASGVKKEEYRKIEQYYYSRFDKPLTHIKFTRGYGKKVPSVTVELLGIGKGIPKPEWSEGEATIEQGKEVFILALGEIVHPESEKDSEWTPMTRQEFDQLNNQIEFTNKQHRMDADEKDEDGEWWLEKLTSDGEPTENYTTVDDDQLEKLKSNGQIWEYANGKECWQPPEKLIERELVIA